MGLAAATRAGMVPEPGFLLFKSNPGVRKSPPPACPAWRLGAGSIPTQSFEFVTFCKKNHQGASNFLGSSKIILPAVKFVVFYLAPALLLIWSTSPDFWTQISFSICVVGDDPSRILHFSKNLLSSGETLVKSLKCDNLVLYFPDLNMDTFNWGTSGSFPSPS
ncbi:hypothetical protein DSO57_1031739 [Entomophthora muscae]|uniref:Uncharacterized protein n=1 Tax=Entomophthora muscae TaxID=34485 RepID=A0ACC2TYI2_9FUNG|nr:hypothetical protein DSO57_1031739 [Entomophthora muscae]